MQSAKETAQNVAASAKSGMEKTKATMQEKAEKMTTRDPLQKELAAEKKDERIHQAELEKQQARQQHAATRQAGSGGGMFGTTGGEYTTTTGHTTGGGVGAGHTGIGTGHGHTAGMGGTTQPVEGMGGGQYPEGQLQDPNVPGGRRTGYGTGGGAI